MWAFLRRTETLAWMKQPFMNFGRTHADSSAPAELSGPWMSEPTMFVTCVWPDCNNSKLHLQKGGPISATSRNKAASASQWGLQHMASQSEANVHNKTHNAPAAPRGPAAPGLWICQHFRLALAGHVQRIPHAPT